MKLKYFSYLLASCLVLSTSHVFAMEEQAEKGSAVHVATRSFEEQLERVSNFVNLRKAANLPIKMVLGAPNVEGDRFPEEWIFFDLGEWIPHDPNGRPYVKANFNNLDHLSALAKTIGPSLTEIVTDDCTFKFSEWTKEHLKLFGSMLNEKGAFIFSPVLQQTLNGDDRHGPLSDESKIWEALKELNSFSLEELPNNFCMPEHIVATPNDSNWPEVTEGVAKFAPLIPHLKFPIEEFDKKMVELRIITNLTPDILGNERLLRKNIAQTLKSSKFENTFYNNCFVPHIRRFLEQCFKEVNVETDVPFLLQISPQNIETLITCKKPLEN